VKEKENVYNNFLSTSLSDFKVEFKMERIFKQIKNLPNQPAHPFFPSQPSRTKPPGQYPLADPSLWL
jgi:hypothetical protein